MTISNQEYTLNSGAPTQIYPYGLQQRLTLKNTGTVTVYVSPIPSLSNGLEIPVGRSVAWEAQNPLYGYTESGTGLLFVVAADVTGQDVVEVNGSVSVDNTVTISGAITGDVNVVNSTPIDIVGSVDITSGTVNVGNTVPITGSVSISGDVTIDSTTPVDIAGSVSVSSGTINVGNVVDVSGSTIGGTVAVSNTVSMTGAVTVTSGTINIGTVAGTVGVSGTVDIGSISGSVTIASGTVNVGTVSGDVTVGGINTPVDIQAGGEILGSGTLSASRAGGTNYVDIALPSSGRAYTSLKLIVSVAANQTTVQQNIFWAVGTATVDFITGVVSSPGTTYTYTDNDVWKETVTFPNGSDGSIRIRIMNQTTGSGSDSISYQLLGHSAPTVIPYTDLNRVMLIPRYTANSGSSFSLLIPPSHTPYVVRLFYSGSQALTGASQIYDPYLGSASFVNHVTQWMGTAIRGNVYEFIYGGSGVPAVLNSNQAPNSNVNINFFPRDAGGTGGS